MYFHVANTEAGQWGGHPVEEQRHVLYLFCSTPCLLSICLFACFTAFTQHLFVLYLLYSMFTQHLFKRNQRTSSPGLAKVCKFVNLHSQDD